MSKPCLNSWNVVRALVPREQRGLTLRWLGDVECVHDLRPDAEQRRLLQEVVHSGLPELALARIEVAHEMNTVLVELADVLGKE